ncbi:MAG: RimK family alpha-L-glutamate ligase [Lachnospiraceae bacterium]|nr:RimK family alpha-L-glutamate ligase [Lachnospiraceae bacterium]
MKAWLIVNGFLHSRKFNEIHSWLMNAAKAQDISIELYTNAQIPARMRTEGSAGTDGILRSDLPDFVLFWDKDVRLAAWLEALGLPVFNSARAIADCDDKSRTHLALWKAGIPMPETILAPMTFANIGYTNLEFLSTVEQALGYPLVIKECFGSFGAQVYLAKNREELLTQVRKIGANPMLFQRFLSESAGRDIRLQVVGDQVIASMYRYSTDGDFRANITNGGSMKRYEPSPEEISLALRSTRALGLDFAGVDILFGADGPVVCEVNSNAHFKNIYDCTGVNAADAIIAHIRSTLITRKKQTD